MATRPDHWHYAAVRFWRRWDDRPGRRVATAATVIVVLLLVGAFPANAAPTPTVSITGTAPGTVGLGTCPGDPPTDVPATATLTRTGDTTNQLAVSYTFNSVPASATFPPAKASVTISFEQGGQLALVDGATYDLGDPSTATILVTGTPKHPCLVMPLTPAASNTSQTVTVGDAPLPLVYQSDAIPVTITSGALPAGLSLNTDGTWSGTAQEVGTFQLTLQFCSFNCVTTDFTLTVVRGRQLARTGPRSTVLLVLTGSALILAGLLCLRASTRRSIRLN